MKYVVLSLSWDLENLEIQDSYEDLEDCQDMIFFSVTCCFRHLSLFHPNHVVVFYIHEEDIIQ